MKKNPKTCLCLSVRGTQEHSFVPLCPNVILQILLHIWSNNPKDRWSNTCTCSCGAYNVTSKMKGNHRFHKLHFIANPGPDLQGKAANEHVASHIIHYRNSYRNDFINPFEVHWPSTCFHCLVQQMAAYTHEQIHCKCKFMSRCQNRTQELNLFLKPHRPLFHLCSFIYSKRVTQKRLEVIWQWIKF